MDAAHLVAHVGVDDLEFEVAAGDPFEAVAAGQFGEVGVGVAEQ